MSFAEKYKKVFMRKIVDSEVRHKKLKYCATAINQNKQQ